MDSLLATAYAIVAVYVGFVIGLLLRGSPIDGRPPGGGEGPSPPPPDLGPDDWARWEEELISTTVS